MACPSTNFEASTIYAESEQFGESANYQATTCLDESADLEEVLA